MTPHDTRYEHRQSSLFLPSLLVVSMIMVLAITTRGGSPGLAIGVAVLMALLTAAIFCFSALITSIDQARIKVAFRYGSPAREIPLSSIISHQAVRNPWWYGFGIRLIPGGWMYNVWGLSAVEVRYDSGAGLKTFRIGTDEPKALSHAIALARESQ